MMNRRPRVNPVEAMQPPLVPPWAVSLKQEEPHPAPPEENKVVGVDHLMLTSLPPIASGADIYMRQFYRNNRLPFRRYLPLRGL